jgi:hypothetical protein
MFRNYVIRKFYLQRRLYTDTDMMLDCIALLVRHGHEGAILAGITDRVSKALKLCGHCLVVDDTASQFEFENAP